MISDDDISAALDPLRPITYAIIPFEGEWLRPPYPDRIVDGRATAVICEEPRISMLVVDRANGEVLAVGPDGETSLVNRSLAQLAACSRAYTRVLDEAEALDEDDTEALARLGAALLATFTAIDPDAVTDGNQLWPFKAEELGYGM
jgi:hypothetical protein